MNILIAADYRAPKSGNFIASLLDLGERLKETGGQAIFLFPDSGGGDGWKNWIRSCGFPLFLIKDQDPSASKLQLLKEIIDQYRIELVHTHFGYLSRLLLQNHRKLGVKLLFHDHMDFSEVGSQTKQHLTTMKRALMYRYFDAYCISVMEKKDRYYWPAGRKRHRFIINGLSLRRAERDELSVEERRKEIGVQENEKLILFLGWDLNRKGLDIVSKAVRAYRETDPSLKLGVIGVGTDGKPSENAIRFLEQAGVDPFSEWILYMHSYEDIFALNRAIDCYVSSSRAEAFAYGILEAISQNTPVVVSDIEGTSWCWEYDKCFVYQTEDPADCAKAIRKAIGAGRAPSNYQMITRKYSSACWCEKILDEYRRILSR